MADKKEELEKKRQRLAELRKQNSKKTDEKSSPTPVTTRKDVDDLLASLVGDTPKKETKVVEEKVEEETIEEEKKEPIILTTIKLESFSYLDKETLKESREVQTDDSITGFDAEIDGKKEIEEGEEEKSSEGRVEEENEDEEEEEEDEEEEEKGLSNDQKQVIFSTESFIDFIERSAKILEEELDEPYDYLIDYATADLDDSESGNLTELRKFSNSITRDRPGTDIHWSYKNPENLIVSYGQIPGSTTNPEGLVIFWNLHNSNPEHVFHSPSPVYSAQFSATSPFLVVGGTYSGQILIWDTRTKNLPIFKTPLSGSAHTHPIYKLESINNTLISMSMDGLLCSWNIENMSKPQEIIELKPTKGDDFSVTTFSIPDNDTSSLYVGTEEGTVYQANLVDKGGVKQGINRNGNFKGHFAPITGIHVHPSYGSIDFSNYFLTSSLDWTVKLWKHDRPKSNSSGIMPPNFNSTPCVQSFEDFGESVYDICWSPTHPALFSSVDGEGRFSLWNLNSNLEVPEKVTQVGNRGLNKTKFDREGKKNAVASVDGSVYIFDIGEMAVPNSNDWHTFQRVLADTKPGSSF